VPRKLHGFLFLGLGFVSICLPAYAHHGNSAYDETTPVAIKGTVTEFAWANPHVQIYLDAKDDNGKVSRWTVETLSPAKLSRTGWSKDSVKPGDQVTLTFYAAKNGSAVGYLLKLVFADGRELGTKETGQTLTVR